MNLRSFFEYSPSIDLTAAQIGINKWNWISINSRDEDEAKRIMSKYRFDVLPISNSRGETNSYFATRNWNNFKHLNEHDIRDHVLIYYRTSFADLVRKFSEERRHYYFMTNHKEVLGLVSFVNLNSQPVYNYLFQLISNIEIKLVRILENEFDEKKVCDFIIKGKGTHLENISKRYLEKAKKGEEDSIYKFLYLHTLGMLLVEFEKDLPSDLKPILQFRKKFCSENVYSNIRNNVMHPVNSVINERVSIDDLAEFLDDYEVIMNIFERYERESSLQLQ